MSQLPLPPNPGLLSILLVIKTGEGIKRVFQYPASISANEAARVTSDGHAANSRAGKRQSAADERQLDEEQNRSMQRERQDQTEQQATVRWDEPPRQIPPQGVESNYLGLPNDFDHLLCPPSSWNRRRFELGVDHLVFVGWPCFAREDGEWRRKKKRSSSAMDPARRMSTISEQVAQARRRGTDAFRDGQLGEVSTSESAVEDTEGEVNTMQSDRSRPVINSSHPTDTSAKTGSSSSLIMFHVVFVMSPAPLEYQARVNSMYKHVVKKFSRALKWKQGRNGFVQRECEKLRAMKAKRDPSSDHVLRSSALARAITTLYSSIASSRIAHIELSPHLVFSLQIPVPTSITRLPDILSPQMPGLWLTTSNLLPPADADQPPAPLPKLASHLALLPLVEVSTLLTDLTAASSSALTAPLAHYLRHSSPDKSFSQISQSSGIPLPDIHFLAGHLIYWRKARAIPPLHQRDVYITSPNADMSRLRVAAVQYARLFPALPTLPAMLSLLSAGPEGPRPFGAIIPSKDHKLAYFGILAWLLRGGWVTQLRAFGWVRVSIEIQQRVHQTLLPDSPSVQRPATPTRAAAEPAGASSATDMRDAKDDHAGNDISKDDPGPAERPAQVFSASPSASSISSTRTAIPFGSQPIKGRSGNPPMSQHPGPAQDAMPTLAPHMVAHPARASGGELQYLAAVAAYVEEVDGPDSRAAWDRCVKYFDGGHALDKIAVREGWKRKQIEAWRAKWVQMGVLVEVRFW